MAKAVVAPAPKFSLRTEMKLVDALFVLGFSIMAIATVVAIGVR